MQPGNTLLEGGDTLFLRLTYDVSSWTYDILIHHLNIGTQEGGVESRFHRMTTIHGHGDLEFREGKRTAAYAISCSLEQGSQRRGCLQPVSRSIGSVFAPAGTASFPSFLFCMPSASGHKVRLRNPSLFFTEGNMISQGS